MKASGDSAIHIEQPGDSGDAPSLSALFRLFVSSTFSDLAAEREALRAQVFAPVSRLLNARGFTLQVVDLRWGITDEAAFGHQTLRICLEQVAICRQRSPRPNFLILAGDRYGWHPPPAVIPEHDFELLCRALSEPEQAVLRRSYRRDTNAVPPVRFLAPRSGRNLENKTWERAEADLVALLSRALARVPLESIPAGRRVAYLASATEQEIHAGLLDVPLAESHVFAVRRTIADLENLMADPRSRAGLRPYLDWRGEHWDREAWRRQRNLHDRIAARMSGAGTGRLFDCTCRFDGRGLSRDHLKSTPLPAPEAAAALQPATLPEAVWRGLWQVLLPEMEAREGLRQRRQSMPGPSHSDAARRQARRCVGREAMLAALPRTIESEGTQPWVLFGPSGVGKSTVLSAFVARMAQAHRDWHIAVRFIGTGPATAGAVALLDGLTTELLPPGVPEEPRLSGDPLSVSASAFFRVLREARAAPVLIVLDALDQLPTADRARIADWLPRRLPPGIRLVVSTTPGPLLEEMRRNWPEAPERFVELEGLDRPGGGAMLDALLAEAQRRLESRQREALLDGFMASRLPLWLDLSGRQALRWTSDAPPALLPGDVEALIAGWFESIARAHGPRLVRRVLGLLAASRRGLSETALWDLCSADPNLQRDLLGTMHHVPQEIAGQAAAQGMTGDPQRWLATIQNDPAGLSEWARRLVAAGVPLPLALWIRLREDLAIYLTERDFLGLRLIDFHHAAIRRVAEQGTEDKVGVHEHMAAYLGLRWEQGDLLALDGIARHLALAGKNAEYADLAANPEWQVMVLRHLGIGALEEAFSWRSTTGLDTEVQEDLDRIEDAITESAHVVSGRRPDGAVGPGAELLPGQLLGRLRGRSGPLLDRFLDRLEAWPETRQSGAAARNLLFPVTACLPAISRRLQRTFAGHDRPVRAVLLSPDGRTVVSCDDWRLLVWDANSGVERLRLRVFEEDPSRALTALALAPGAGQVLAAASDGRFRLFDLASGTLEREWPAHAPGDTLVAGAPEVPLIVSAGVDRSVRVWRWDRPEHGELLFQSDQHVTAVAMDAVRPVAALGFADGGLAVWDLAARAQTGAGKASARITALSVEAATEQAWWGDSEGRVGTWLYRKSPAEAWPAGHLATVTGLALCSGGRLISVGHDVAVRCWHRSTAAPAEEGASGSGSVVSAPVGHCYRILAAAACNDRPVFATASMDTTVRLWDADAAETPPARPGHRSIIVDTAIDTRRRQALTASKDGAIERWHLGDGVHLGTLGHHRISPGLHWQPGDPASPPWLCSRVLLAPDGRHLVSAGSGSLCWWDLDDPARGCIRQVALPGDPLNDLTWSAGGQALALIFGNLHAGDAWEGRWVHCRLPGSVWRLAASPDGHTLALVEYRGVILGELHEDHLENVRVLPHRAQPLAAAFLPDGRSVLTAGHDRYLHLWNLEPDQPPLLVGRHEREIWDLAVSADGETAATVGDDRWVALWDIPRRRLRACFRAEGPMIRLSMDPAATFVATGDEAGRPVILRQAPAP